MKRKTSNRRRLADALTNLSWSERLREIDGRLSDLFEEALSEAAIRDIQAGSNIRWLAPDDATLADVAHKLSDAARTTLTDALVLLGEPAGPVSSAAEAAICLMTSRPAIRNIAVRWINGNGLEALRRELIGLPGIALLMLAASYEKPTDDTDSLVRMAHRMVPGRAKGRAA
ncbi:hypothetical protein [Azospirillum rugosum]|uniref:DUF2336 domain-containing protein n=1 Tax=Azospirillum rugosum TaxID=416170 RepID=A0ABS4SF33_9PROT|nr:hypothetical protein [Azospirillum rugosum]MBP2291020.1 hypothetical protein [Azospirillum rugosum]MDQ0524916.1 hypothetical protein [Azospirillum rugosum]